MNIIETNNNQILFTKKNSSNIISSAFRAGRVSAEIRPKGHLPDNDFADNLGVRIKLDKKMSREKGFLAEFFVSALSPTIGCVALIQKCLHTKNMPLPLRITGIAIGFLGFIPSLALCPLTILASPLIAAGRVAIYAATHSTVEMEEEKFYINTREYKKVLAQISGQGYFSTKELKGVNFLNFLEDAALAPLNTQNEFNNLLNQDLSNAFNDSNWEAVQQLLSAGANPHTVITAGDPDETFYWGYIYSWIEQIDEAEGEKPESFVALVDYVNTHLPESAKHMLMVRYIAPDDLQLPNLDLTNLSSEEKCSLLSQKHKENKKQIYLKESEIALSTFAQQTLNAAATTEGLLNGNLTIKTYRKGTAAQFRRELE